MEPLRSCALTGYLEAAPPTWRLLPAIGEDQPGRRAGTQPQEVPTLGKEGRHRREEEEEAENPYLSER